MANKIVLLIDLHPLTHTQNPNTYIHTIITCSKSLLLKKADSKSAFKLFFSSLLPSLSPYQNPLVFRSHSETLIFLEEELNSVCISKFRVFDYQNENLPKNCSDSVSKTLDYDNLVSESENSFGEFEKLQKNRSNSQFSEFEKNCFDSVISKTLDYDNLVDKSENLSIDCDNFEKIEKSGSDSIISKTLDFHDFENKNENPFGQFENSQKIQSNSLILKTLDSHSNRSNSENSTRYCNSEEKGENLIKNRSDLEKYENLLKNRSISIPRASHVAGSLFQITRDYKWEKKGENLSKFGNLIKFRSNLVLLFSPIGKLSNWLSEFMNDDESDSEKGDFLGNIESFRGKFSDIFRSVDNAYVKRDIHCCWIDIGFDNDYNVMNNNDYLSRLELFKSGVRALGWGFCSSDSIILGNVIIPFELIYPLFGATSNYLALFDSCKPIRTQLLLEIMDTKGEPLVSNCCDLELFCLKESKTTNFSDAIRTLKVNNLVNEAVDNYKRIWSCFDGGIKSIQIKSVQKCARVAKENCPSDVIFVRGDYSKEPCKSCEESCGEFFADRVLEAVCSDIGEFVCSKNGPTWQLLLSFLSRNSYKATVSVVCEKGDSFTAILDPFTVHLALLYIVDDGYIMEIESNQSKLTNTDGTLTKSKILASRNRKKGNMYKDLTWASFRKAAFEQTAFELEEAYFGGVFTVSKKLKFLKCWMKQVTKSNNVRFTIQENADSCKHMEIDTGVRLLGTGEDSQEPNSLRFHTEPARVLESAVIGPCIETKETFLRDLPKKIQHGLESKGVDLQILAERLVNLSIYWLSQKNETCISVDNEGSNLVPGDSHGNVVSNLIKLLLKEPKKLKDEAKNNGLLSSASASVNLVREHELQIFFRMEILRSKIADSIEASTKRKFVKQICALLEIIQYLVEGGFHGEITLYGYIEKTVKARYFHVLEDVVNKIYARMDLLPIGDEDYSPIFLLNSEDSNQSWRATGTTASNRVSSSGENDVLKNEVDYLQEDISKDNNSLKVLGVQGRREKALRYLRIQRVLAPKHAKGMPVKPEAARKPIKRKERSKKKDVVCETPFFDKKRETGDRFGSVSVSKALFQDDN